jgi:nucleoporin SEH1
VEFAPRHLGLRLAAAGADGVVRVYEAVDVMNLSHWPLQVCECVNGWMDHLMDGSFCLHLPLLAKQTL